jgi:hypothetical protein
LWKREEMKTGKWWKNLAGKESDHANENYQTDTQRY